MTEKYASGRFCSKSCASSKVQSAEANEKRRAKAKKRNEQSLITVTLENTITQVSKKEFDYMTSAEKPRCEICGKELSFKRRTRKTCSDDCQRVAASIRAKKNKLGGITKGHGTGNGGYYKGIRCDSRYELIYLIHCLDSGLDIIRNTKAFDYKGEDGKIHKYYPDFYIKDTDTFIEIKGYYRPDTLYKIAAMIEQKVNYEIKYWEDLKPLLLRIKEKHAVTYNSLLTLYDK